MYGSEIWGDINFHKLNTQGDNYFKKLCGDLAVEKAHLSFCKFILGVSKKATNIAVMGELGRYPLFLEVLLNMFKYYIRLKKSDDLLLKEAFNLSKSLHDEQKKSWYTSIQTLFKYFSINENYALNLKTKLKNYLCKKMQSKYDLIWQTELNNDFRGNKLYGNKLRTYRLFKSRFCLENYLLQENFRYRHYLTKFRISAHDLEIERGRYKNLTVSERICKLCGTEVEDEIHFLLQCQKHSTIRFNF